MSIDMTKLARLGSVGLAKVLTMIPKGQAEEGIQFAFKVKKAAWVKGDYGYRYHLDVVVRTLDMQAVLGSELWKVYPSLLPQEITEAIDTDFYDDTWWLVYTEANPRSKADPPKTRLHLIDTQQGLNTHTEDVDAPSVPLKHTEGEAAVNTTIASPSTPCPHENVYMLKEGQSIGAIDGPCFCCTDCGERVG